MMNILIAIDGSERSRKAISEVAKMLWPAQSRVRVILVEMPVDTGIVPTEMPSFDKLVRKQQSVSLRHLEDAAAELSKNNAKLLISTVVLGGRPKDVIVDEAERFAADLVIVGSHGLGPIRRYFLGSVSQYVVNNAHCSVLVVR